MDNLVDVLNLQDSFFPMDFDDLFSWSSTSEPATLSPPAYQPPANGITGAPVVLVGMDSVKEALAENSRVMGRKWSEIVTLLFGRKSECSLIVQLQHEIADLTRRNSTLQEELQRMSSEMTSLKDRHVVLIPDAFGVQFLKACKTTVELNTGSTARVCLQNLPGPSSMLQHPLPQAAKKQPRKQHRKPRVAKRSKNQAKVLYEPVSSADSE